MTRLRFEHILIYQRALRVLCGLQIYWRESPMMRDRFLPTEKALIGEFADVRFRLEVPVIGWWRAPHAEQRGTFKPAETSGYVEAWFAESLGGQRYYWQIDRQLADTGEGLEGIWSVGYAEIEARHWPAFRDNEAAHLAKGIHVIEHGWRRVMRRAAVLSAVEAVLLPLDRARVIGALPLAHFVDRKVDGQMLTEAEFRDARMRAAMEFDYPEGRSRDAKRRLRDVEGRDPSEY